MDLKNKYKSKKLADLAKNRDYWKALVNLAENFDVPYATELVR